MRNTVVEFFAHQLNTDPDLLAASIDTLEKITDKKNALEEVYEEVQENSNQVLKHLGFTHPTAEEIFTSLEGNVATLDKKIFQALGKPLCNTSKGCMSLIEAVLDKHEQKKGFFLKKDVAGNLLKENPPQNILAELGYESVDEMLRREDLFEVYAALRFMEDRDWLNTNYLLAYRNLKEDDFETRPIQIKVLDGEKWEKVTKAFLKKKLHPMSHLKELGFIFIIPSSQIHQILTAYLFGMTSHYLNEITLYSNYFKYYSSSSDFGRKIVSAIRGDVPEVQKRKSDHYLWLVIQRYLFKENPSDPRLGVPHINPEAAYHASASVALEKLEKIAKNLSFHFDGKTDWLATWMPTKNGKQVLVNFNFMDNAMSLMNKLPFEERYDYHFHEALWNKIFTTYFGEDKLLDVVIKHLLDGWFDIRKI